MMLDTFMQQLAKELEAGTAFATEVPGVYTFPVNEELSITISEIPRGFSLHCDVTECPKENVEEFFTQALFANLYSHGTDGSTLGLDAEGEILTLSRKIDYNINYQEFKDIIEDFTNTVELWEQETGAYKVTK